MFHANTSAKPDAAHAQREGWLIAKGHTQSPPRHRRELDAKSSRALGGAVSGWVSPPGEPQGAAALPGGSSRGSKGGGVPAGSPRPSPSSPGGGQNSPGGPTPASGAGGLRGTQRLETATRAGPRGVFGCCLLCLIPNTTGFSEPEKLDGTRDLCPDFQALAQEKLPRRLAWGRSGPGVKEDLAYLSRTRADRCVLSAPGFLNLRMLRKRKCHPRILYMF